MAASVVNKHLRTDDRGWSDTLFELAGQLTTSQCDFCLLLYNRGVQSDDLWEPQFLAKLKRDPYVNSI